MSALSIQPTFPIFTGTDGLPLENGYIWIGAANLDPQGNPISVYWDEALTISASQPIRTLNGYASRSGTPANIYVNSDYSIRVQDSKGSAVYSNLFVSAFITTDMLADGAVTTPKIADGAVTTPKIANSAVTYAKIQNVSAGKVLGRDTSGAGIVQELPISVDVSGNTSFVGTLNSVGNIDTNSRLLVGTRTASSGGGGNVQYRNDTGTVQWASGVLGTAGSTDFNVYNIVASTYGLTIDTSANLKFNSGYGSVATAYGCRAWVNFNGSGTVAIRASGNVSSITDNGTGDYTINFATALTDANYALVGSGKIDDTNSDGNAPIVGLRRSTSAPTTTAARITTVSSVNVALDCTYVSVAVFR
jgi:hypothetical protein